MPSTNINKEDKIRVLLIFVFMFLFLTSRYLGLLAAQGFTKLTYSVSLSGTVNVYGVGRIRWKAYGNLILYDYGNDEIRLRLNINYISPSIPGLFDEIKPELEELLFNLKEALGGALKQKSSLFSRIIIPYYSNDLKTMMKCPAKVKVDYYSDQEGVTLFMPKEANLPIYIAFNGKIEGEATLSSAQGFVCGSPLVSNETRKMLLYLTFGISLTAIISFAVFRSRWKNFYWRYI